MYSYYSILPQSGNKSTKTCFLHGLLLFVVNQNIMLMYVGNSAANNMTCILYFNLFTRIYSGVGHIHDYKQVYFFESPARVSYNAVIGCMREKCGWKAFPTNRDNYICGGLISGQKFFSFGGLISGQREYKILNPGCHN